MATLEPPDPAVSKDCRALRASKDRQDRQVSKDHTATVHLSVSKPSPPTQQKSIVINLTLTCISRLRLATKLSPILCQILTVSVADLVALVMGALNTCGLIALTIYLYRNRRRPPTGWHNIKYVFHCFCGGYVDVTSRKRTQLVFRFD